MGAVSFTLTSKVGPCRDVLSVVMFDANVHVPTYIIGDCGNILEAREEADLVRTGIFVWYTKSILGLPGLLSDGEILTMDTYIPPGRLNVLLDKI